MDKVDREGTPSSPRYAGRLRQRDNSSSQPGNPESLLSLEERVESLEKRLEKAEHLLHIAEDMNKLHQELDEIRNNEVSRKLEDLDQRIQKMEAGHSDVLFECESKIKETIGAMEREVILGLETREKDVKALQERVEEVTLPSKEVQNRLSVLENETDQRVSAMLSTLEDLVKHTKKNDFQINESREMLKQVESEQVHLLLLAREHESRQARLSALETTLETILKTHNSSEEQDDVEVFLRNI